MRVFPLCVLAVVLASASASADEPKPWAAGVSEVEQATALGFYREGNSEFGESRYAQALAKYREALKHWDHPGIRFNMAVCLVNLDQPLEAFEHLLASLRHGEAALGAEAHAQALTYKKLLGGQLATLRVVSKLERAEVTLDGKLVLDRPGEVTKLVIPGRHQIVATKPGFLTTTTALVLLPGKELTHEVTMVPLVAKARTVRRWKARTPWLVVGVGAATAALGGVAEYLSNREYATYDRLFAEQCPNGCGPAMPEGMQAVASSTQSHATRGKVYNVLGVSLLAIGGAGVVAGLVGVYLNIPRSVVERAPQITPSATAGGGGVSLGWAW